MENNARSRAAASGFAASNINPSMSNFTMRFPGAGPWHILILLHRTNRSPMRKHQQGSWTSIPSPGAGFPVMLPWQATQDARWCSCHPFLTCLVLVYSYFLLWWRLYTPIYLGHQEKSSEGLPCRRVLNNSLIYTRILGNSANGELPVPPRAK